MRSPRLSLKPVFFALFAIQQVAAQPVIRDFVFRQFEGGPAWDAGQTARSGDNLVFSFSIGGLKTFETDNEEKKIRYEWTAQALDPKDVALAEPLSGKQEAEILPEDKDWVPKISGTVKLPDFLPGGSFHLTVSVRDAVANVSTKSEFSFPVAGPPNKAADTIVIQDVRFFREEASNEPISPAAYRPGDTIWIRFQMSGFQANSAKEVHVRYGYELKNPAGKVVFSQPQALEERRSYFYPPAYLPAILSFTPDAKVPRGEYTVFVAAEDAVSGQQVQSEQKFRIE
jgi:hypothetical protein